LSEKELQMASQGPKVPSPSFPFRLRLPKVIRELHHATKDILEGSWNPDDMARVSEIASNLAEACRMEGLREAATIARSIASLMRVPPDQILPVQAAFRAKIKELMRFLKATANELLNGTG
jgi:hypothetical protein